MRDSNQALGMKYILLLCKRFINIERRTETRLKTFFPLRIILPQFRLAGAYYCSRQYALKPGKIVFQFQRSEFQGSFFFFPILLKSRISALRTL